MQDRINTDSLMKRIFRTKSLTSFFEHNEQYMQPVDFCGMLSSLCEERDLVPERVILRAQIDRTYGHQLFNGTRRPSRDKVIQLSIAMGLSLEETKRLLQAAGKSTLYPRLKRDTAIIYCLKNRLSMADTQAILQEHGLMPLGEVV